MKAFSFLGIIPARYASTRFPGKPLIDILGKPMIQRVYEQAAKTLSDVIVATDDERILEAVKNFGGKAIMTSEKHKSGTDRCFEAYQKYNKKFDILINIQGDEPEIQIEQIKQLQECFEDENTEIASLAKIISEKDGETFLSNPNHVKVVIDKNNFALYFSRSPIPYNRNVKDEKTWIRHHNYYKHIGLYAYKSEVLAQISNLPSSPLELSESLEQLRWLENGYRIKMGITSVESIGIDTPEDLERLVKKYLS